MRGEVGYKAASVLLTTIDACIFAVSNILSMQCGFFLFFYILYSFIHSLYYKRSITASCNLYSTSFISITTYTFQHNQTDSAS